MALVRAALAELAAVDARQVLGMANAVALGTGSFKSQHDARTLRESYLRALQPERPVVYSAEPTAAEREVFGLDLIEQMRAEGKLV